MPNSISVRAKKKQQTRLEFATLSSSSPARDKYSSAVQSSNANGKRTDSRNTPASSPPEPRLERESPLTPEPSSPATKSIPDQIASSPSYVNGSEEDDVPTSKRRRLVRGSRREEQATPSRKSRRIATQEQLLISSPPRRLFRRPSSESDSGAVTQLSELGEPETTGDEDDVLVTQPSQRRRQRVIARDEFVVDDTQVEYVSSDEEPASRPKLRKSRLRRRSQHEQEELEDDLADLQDSDRSDNEMTPRTRGGPVNTQRDKARQHFELLKRRRAGEKVPYDLDSDAERDYNDNDEEKEKESVDLDDTVSGLVDTPHVISDDGAQADAENDAEEPEEDDFVVDDTSSGHLGLLHSDIPLEFTSYASAKPKDLFVHVIEWFVKNRLAPTFSRDDPIYQLALSKIADQVTAHAGSRLISSAWNADFKYAILARPDLRITPHNDYLDDDIRTCDACNKINHPAKFDFVLSGEPYRKRDLEPVDHDPDDEEEKTQDYDEAGHLLPSQTTHFYLGSVCANNAKMGHKFVHWRYHLNQDLLKYLEKQGVLSQEAVFARDKLNNKKKEKEAEAIVDSMQKTGVIKELWKGFKNDLDDAMVGMEG